MKVLLIHWGQTGGGPRFLHELATTWHEISPDEIAWSFNSHARQAHQFRTLRVPSLEVTTYNRSKIGVVLGLPRLIKLTYDIRRFISHNAIDTVVCVMPSIYQSVVVPIAVPRDVMYMACIHDAIPHPGEKGLVQFILPRLELRRANKVVVFSEAVANQILDRHRHPPGHITMTIHPAWRTHPDRRRLVRDLPVDRPVVVGFFGRLIEYKGLAVLIDSVRMLRQRGLDVRLAVHGQGPDGKLRGTAEDVPGTWDVRWIAEYEIESIVDGFDVLALPYREASQSGVLAQALSLGIPCVATPVGGLREQVRESGAGLLSDETSPESFARSIEDLILDAPLYRRCSANALHAADTAFSWTRVVRDIRGAIQSL